jgi:hypothetical protein
VRCGKLQKLRKTKKRPTFRKFQKIKKGRNKTMNISELTRLLASERIMYKTDFDKLTADRDSKLKQIDKEFNKGTPRYTAEKAKVNNDFTKAVEGLRTASKKNVIPEFTKMLDHEKAKVLKVDNILMSKVSMLVNNTTLTPMETQLLIEEFGGKDYHVDKLLKSTAEQNGLLIDGLTSVNLSADYDTKVSILGQLQSQYESFISDYDGKPNATTIVLLDDTVLQRAESLYNGKSDTTDTAEPQNIARTVMSLIKSKDNNPISQGMILKNALANANEAVKSEILTRIATSDISSIALEFANVTDSLQAFKNKELTEYSTAQKAFNDMENASTIESGSAVLKANKDNKYLSDMVNEATKGGNVKILNMVNTVNAETADSTATTDTN